MKTTHTEKQDAREAGNGSGMRRRPVAKGRDSLKPFKAAADIQIAEIERTFTLRYEW